MNDKSLEVLKQYDLTVNQMSRGRGGMVLETNAGIKLFLECERPNSYYERENALTKLLAEAGFSAVDTFVRNKEDGLVSETEDGKRYVVKDWFPGRECNVKCVDEVSLAVRSLGELHKKLNQIGVVPEVAGRKENCAEGDGVRESGGGMVVAAEVGGITPMKNVYQRHMKELKLAGNYLRGKRNKSEFEQIAYKNIGAFYQEASNAVERMNQPELMERFMKAKSDVELCHGNYNYHNAIYYDGIMAVTNFDRYRNECQISDLYQFMRKIMEKYDWDMEMAYKMLDEYDKVKTLTDTDLELLSVLFSFPEKFWKVINFYFNSSKSWIPRKSIEKLKTVVEQNEKRQKFLETIS